MGKPTQWHLSKKSNHSMRRNSSRTKVAQMSNQKSINKKRQHHNKMQNNITKLINDLRNESRTSLNSLDSTVIILDDSVNSTNKGQKRTCPEPDSDHMCKRQNRCNGSLIIINDDNETETRRTPGSSPVRKSAPMQCSTPIKKGNDNLKDLIISSFPNSNNNTIIDSNIKNEIHNLTKEINRDSYVTIDLTTETLNCTDGSKNQNTVIDLINATDNTDCTVSLSNANLSMSGDSDVTVLNISRSKTNQKVNKQMRRVFSGINKLDSTEKNKMLEYVVTTILNGCNVPERVKSTVLNFAEPKHRSERETAEDAYIKEVIVGRSQSRNSIGSNIYNPGRDLKNHQGLRMVVIDGSNVAMEHGMGKVFSVRGLKICIDYFLKRGHAVKAFVPRFRCKSGKSTEPLVLSDLERRGLVVFTPSREIQGRLIASYDDRYIVQCAAEFDAVIVSGDNYRDLLQENPRWRFVIENRLLPFTWVHDMIMFPKDPLGRNGPTLDQFLKHSAVVPATINKNS